MIYFVEPSIEKKIKLVEYLYIDHQLETTYLQKKLAISKSTLDRYIKEINEGYITNNHNVTLYNRDLLKKIIHNLLDQSNLLSLFKEIVFHPGQNSASYREKLLLMPTTFTRLMGQLKEELSHFNMTVVIDNGYWIKASSEYEFIMLISGIINLFEIDKAELIEFLNKAERKVYQEKIKKNLYTFNIFEREVLNNVVLVTLMREKQYRLAKKGVKGPTLEDVFSYVFSVYDQNRLETYDHYKNMIDMLYHSKIKFQKRKKLVEILVRTTFYIKLLPYSLEVLDFEQDFFIRKMYIEHSKRGKTLEYLIYQLSRLLDTDFTFYKNNLMYSIVSSNLLLFENEGNFKL